ncbi:MAG: iron complex outermembrane recepter protein [bacterium]|nr:MAG: iron complex outermembrane recepter protein [bacterium]
MHVGGSLLWQAEVSPSGNSTGHIGVGVDEAWQDGSILFYNLTPEGNRGTTLVANQREGANSAGVFLQGDAVIADVWQARASIRYDNVWYISENRTEPALNDDQSFTHWTPRVTLGRAIGRQNIYASIAGGLESPAFNEIDPPAPYDTLTSLNPFLGPTFSTTYEIGIRGRAAKGLDYDVAGYWIDVTDDLVPFDGGSYFETAGKVRRQGIEGSLDWKAADHWSFLLTGSVAMNEYVEYVNDRGDFSGNRMAPLPDWFGSGTAEFRITPTLKLNGGIEAVGSLFADDANTQEVDGWVTGNIGADWTRLIGGTTMHIFGLVQNVADKAHTSSVFINGSDGRYIEPGLPRNLVVGLTLGW